jgi:hypothetical protein
LPDDYELKLGEKYVVLALIHDHLAAIHVQRIDPWYDQIELGYRWSGFDPEKKGIPAGGSYYWLQLQFRRTGIRSDSRCQLEQILADVRQDLERRALVKTNHSPAAIIGDAAAPEAEQPGGGSDGEPAGAPLDKLLASIPKFDSESVDWITVDGAAKLAHVKTATLRTGRSNGVKAKDGRKGIATAGRK